MRRRDWRRGEEAAVAELEMVDLVLSEGGGWNGGGGDGGGRAEEPPYTASSMNVSS